MRIFKSVFLAATAVLTAACTQPTGGIPDVVLSTEFENGYQEVSSRLRPVLQRDCSSEEMVTVEKAWRFNIHLMEKMNRHEQLSQISDQEKSTINRQYDAVAREIGTLSPRCEAAYRANE